MKWLTSILLSLFALQVASAAPRVTQLSMHGLQIGQPTTIVISGADLLDAPTILLPVKIASQTIKPGATAARVEIEITIDAEAQPGIYPLRLASSKGVSAPVLVGVDTLPQLVTPPTPLVLPLALHGSVGANVVQKFEFVGKKNDKLVVDCEAQRIGSGLKPVIRLYGNRGAQVAWSPPRRQLSGDARLETVLPEDGNYTIELHDQLLRPAGSGYYRLKIGDLSYADLTLPLGVKWGEAIDAKVSSGSAGTVVRLDAAATTEVAQSDEILATIASKQGFTGHRPLATVSNFIEATETAETTEKGQPLATVPVAVTGTLATAGEADKYLIDVVAGQKLRLQVFAQRVGSSIDAVLSVRKPGGAQLATSDDASGSADPLLDFNVPGDTPQLEVVVTDMQRRAGADHTYRLAISDLARPDFDLLLTRSEVNIAAGSAQLVRVDATRRNYNGPIELKFLGLPAGITVSGNLLAEGSSSAIVVLAAAADAQGAAGVRVLGTSPDGAVSRVASFAPYAGTAMRGDLRTQFAVAIAEKSPLEIVWQANDADRLPLGNKLAIPLKLTSSAMGAKYRLKAITTQQMPKKTVKVNNADQVVDDVERTLRLESAELMDAVTSDVVAQLLVPADLPKQPWDIAIEAELVSADGKTVLASVVTPVRRIETVVPFSATLSSPPMIQAKAGDGETGKFTGAIVRQFGFTGDLAVTLENLPKGLTAPVAIIPADKNEFELEVRFPFAVKPQKIAGATLVVIQPPVSATSVRSASIPVEIEVIEGTKPVAEQPQVIFEDEPEFVATLTQGAGKVELDERQKYSGKAGLKITPDQKHQVPAAEGIKIRENPGPGEFRYLRYAWRKQGGNSICLQLNHDGTWGPGGTGREGAKFRYHAGPGGECYGASVVIDEKLPGKFAVVTRDLFADFGEFTLTGIAFSAVDGQAAFFDHLYLGRSIDDFTLLKPGKAE